MTVETTTHYPALQKEWVVYHPSVELLPVQHTWETLTNWAKWLEDPDVHLWMTGDVPQTLADVNQWLEHATTDPLRHYFAIYADGNMAGIVNLRQDQEPRTTAEIGIVIGDPIMRSRGIGTDAVGLALEKAKNDFNIHKVRAHIHPENDKSLRLFASQGFTYVGNATINGQPMRRFEKFLS